MMNWNYNAADYNPKETALLRIGHHNVRITNVSQTFAKNGTEGIEISLEVYGYNNKLRHYIWFNYENPGYTNMQLGSFFDSFGIFENERNNFDCWIGKEGVVNISHVEYKGRMIAKVSSCISKEFQRNASLWQTNISNYQNTSTVCQNAAPTNQGSAFGNQSRNFSTEPVNTYYQPQTQAMSLDGFKF